METTTQKREYKRLNPTELKQLVEDWNGRHSERVAVDVLMDDGSHLQTKTRSAAWVMGGHSAVVLIDGISGGYSLQRVRALQ